MENTFENGKLTIILNERIDTSNADETEKEVFSLIDEKKPESIVFDASKLEYISSVGLRMVLKVKKAVSDTKIINTSLEVYDIFSMTGFTDILDISKKIREISVDGCEVIGRGGHGTVYRLDGDTIVKLYGEKEPLDEIEREISFSKKSFVYGIPTAISFDIVKYGNCYGVVFELINADTFANTLAKQPEKFDEYSKKYSDIVKKLHETKADTKTFSNIKTLYNKWIDDMSSIYNEEELQILHDVINNIPDRDTFIHGDIHPKNVMVQDGELLFIDMADLSYGHPIFDFAGMALTHIVAAQYIKPMFGIEADIAAKLFNNMLKDNFPDKTEAELEKMKQIILGYAYIKYAISPAVNKAQDRKLSEAIIQNSNAKIIPASKRLIGANDF